MHQAPHRQRVSFAYKAFAVCLAALALTALFLGYRMARHLEHQALKDSSVIAQLVKAHVVSALDLPSAGPLKTEHFSEVPRVLEGLEEANIISVKVWSPGGDVIYSTDSGQIGKRYPLGDQLRKALAGEPVHEMLSVKTENRGERQDGQVLFEAYLPLRLAEEGRVAGVFEVYQAPPALVRELVLSRVDVWASISVLFLALYAVLTVLFYRSVARPVRAIVGVADRLRKGDRAEDDNLGAGAGDVQASLSGLAKELEAREGRYYDLCGELEAKDIDLNESTRLRSEFLANMSHELRTPLNSILGFTQLVLEGSAGSLSPEQQRDLWKVVDSSKHLLTIINDILDLSKIDAGRVTPSPQLVALEDLARDVSDDYLVAAANKGIRIELDVEPGLKVWADTDLVGQILDHLLSNAIKFTDEGFVRVEGRRDGPAALIAVHDTGTGISEEAQAVVWNDFRQGDGSSTRKHGGTGLGLSIAKRLVEIQGGETWLESTPGRGSSFFIRLPQPETAGGSALLPRDLPDPGTALLCVDDDPQALEIIERYIREAGYPVVGVTSGAEAIDLAKKIKPPLITLDVLLKGTDGWRILAALRADPETSGIPVVMLTIVDAVDTGNEAGAADYLVKPVSKEVLVDSIRAILASQDAEILVVDEDRQSAKLLDDVLSSKGYRVTQAVSSEEALRQASERRPAAVLVDVKPSCAGVEEVTRGLSALEMTRGVPVVLMTSFEPSGEVLASLNAQAVRVISRRSTGPRELVLELRKVIKDAA